MTEVGHINVGLGLDDAKFKKGLKDAQNQTLNFAKTMRTALAGIAAGFTVGAIVRGINASVEAFRTQEVAVKSLNQALSNAGVYSYEYSQHLQQLASDIQKVSNYGDEATIKAIGLGQAFAGNVKMTDELIKATVDFASATGTDLDSAFKLVGRSIGSQTNALSRYGIELDKNMTAEQRAAAIQEQLGQKFKGSMSEMSNASVQMSNSLGDLSEKIGQVLNPAVSASQRAIARWADAFGELIDQVRIAKAEINSLGIAELQTKLRQVWVEQDKWNTRFDKMLFGDFARQNDTHLKQLNEEEKAIKQRLSLLSEQEKTQQKVSASTYKSASGASGKISSGSSPLNQAMEEYNNFVAEFKRATDEYNATLRARNYVEKTLGIGLDSSEFQSMVNAYSRNKESGINETCRNQASTRFTKN